LDNTLSSKESADTGQTTISLESVRDNIKQTSNENELLKAGLQAVCKQLEAGQGAIYKVVEEEGRKKVEMKSGYALSIGESTVISYDVGEGLIGQTAAGGKTLYLDDVPEGYVKIVSGLGSASPRFLLIVPVKQQDNVLGVIEIASFTPITTDQRKFAEESAQLMAEKITGKKA
jgi:GAF domain-containing protein